MRALFCPRVLATLVLLAAAGCIEAPMPMDEMPCPPTGTQHTYASFGAGFMASYCNECHSTGKNGAPIAFEFDTVEDVRRHADRIFIRAAGPNTTMPVGPMDPPADERDRLAEWLACGAP